MRVCIYVCIYMSMGICIWGSFEKDTKNSNPVSPLGYFWSSNSDPNMLVFGIQSGSFFGVLGILLGSFWGVLRGLVGILGGPGAARGRFGPLGGLLSRGDEFVPALASVLAPILASKMGPIQDPKSTKIDQKPPSKNDQILIPFRHRFWGVLAPFLEAKMAPKSIKNLSKLGFRTLLFQNRFLYRFLIDVCSQLRPTGSPKSWFFLKKNNVVSKKRLSKITSISAPMLVPTCLHDGFQRRRCFKTMAF